MDYLVISDKIIGSFSQKFRKVRVYMINLFLMRISHLCLFDSIRRPIVYSKREISKVKNKGKES